ncbi:acyltransferase [Cohnella sp.]|uniref:acyltransferase family protein n=1 Tax=Cohnella sp. TaxID=1883426 RepID=UPI0035661012
MTNLNKTKNTSRQWDLDWIKVLVMLIVFLYHCSMFVNPFDWHIKNNQIDTSYMLAFSLLVGSWMMPVFFAISGISTSFALRKRSGGAFVRERLSRLGVPLLLGMFVLAPPQVYVERESTGHFTGSFLQFLPHYFDGVYVEIGGTGNFSIAGHHLWYLLLLLVFSVVTLPVFVRLRKEWKDKPFGHLQYGLLLIPLLAAALTVNDVLNLASWGIVLYLLIYSYGFLFFSRPAFRSYVHRSGWWTGASFGASLLVCVSWPMIGGFPPGGTVESLLYTALRMFMVWNAMFFIFYVGQRWLTRKSGFLTYASEALMPFYVLHQPVIVLMGYGLYQLELPLGTKMLLLILGSFAIIMGMYHFVVRRVEVVQFMLGNPVNARKGMATSEMNRRGRSTYGAS